MADAAAARYDRGHTLGRAGRRSDWAGGPGQRRAAGQPRAAGQTAGPAVPQTTPVPRGV